MKNDFTIVNIEPDEEEINRKVDKRLAILPLRDIVMFPGIVIPVAVGRDFSRRLVKDCSRRDKLIGVFTQKNDVELPHSCDMYVTGTICKILRVVDMPDGTMSAILQGLHVAEMTKFSWEERFRYFRADVKVINEIFPSSFDEQYSLMCDYLEKQLTEFCQLEHCTEMMQSVVGFKSKVTEVNFVCATFPITLEEKMTLLEEKVLKERLSGITLFVINMLKRATLMEEIKRRAQTDLDQQQREYFLQHQLRVIQSELGDGEESDIYELRKEGEKKGWDIKTQEIFEKELHKLERTPSNAPEYNIQYAYLQTLLSLPFREQTQDNFNLASATRELDMNHYGMQKVKDRILEQLSVFQLNDESRMPILCLYGPPGTGKTSIGKSIANALGREYVRVSLGGLHDESEIRGHRRTYIGAMPGRIIKGMIKAGTRNPVFVLDEIDKVSQMTHNGDPSSALLEVLDPEQNTAFHDNYIDLDYDLSHVMFIATANNIHDIPAPLLDRMELIEVSGYVTEEKIEIARKHLFPRALLDNAVPEGNKVKFPKGAVEYLIERYTRESGVRELQKKLNTLARRMSHHYVAEGHLPDTKLSVDLVRQLLGVEEFTRDIYQGNQFAGVVTGLAWTAMGGEILFVETSLSKGKGGKLTMTGNLGNVMKESATLAVEYLRCHAAEWNIDPDIFDQYNIHVHVPEGATPKDGPSAGITITTSILSAITQRKVRESLAMTGEITLRGKVLPVGGIKEKILAAKRAGIREIILCSENVRNIKEIDEHYLKGVTFHYVDTISEVLHYALLKEQVKNPVIYTIDKQEGKS